MSNIDLDRLILTSTSSQNKKKKQKKKNEIDKPWYIDTLEFLQPGFDALAAVTYRPFVGAVADATDGKGNPIAGLGKGFVDNLTMKKKTDFDEVMNNLGWKQNERNQNYNFFKGRKGSFDLFDIVNFAGNTVFDPTTYATFGASSAIKAGQKAAYGALKDAPKSVLKKSGIKSSKELDSRIADATRRYERTDDSMLKNFIKSEELDSLYNIKKELDKATQISQKLGTNASSRGQRRAVERVISSQYDDTMTELGQRAGVNNAYRTVKTPEGTERIVDDGLKMVDGVKSEAALNPRLVEKLAQKRKDDMIKLVDDAAKANRVKFQNSAVNLDVPFTNVVFQLAKKGKNFKVTDPLITATQANALAKLMSQAGATPQQIELLNSGKATKQQVADIVSKVGFTDEQKVNLIRAVSNNRTDDVNQLTRQEFDEAVRRSQDANLRQLDNIGQENVLRNVEQETDIPSYQQAVKEGLKSKHFKNIGIKNVSRETRKLLDELDYVLQISKNKGLNSPISIDDDLLKKVQSLPTVFPKQKGVKPNFEANMYIKSLIDDVNKNLNYKDIVNSTAKNLPKNKNFTGLDLTPFKIDMGGASKVGAALRRKNPFNARTLNSLDENVNEMGNVIRDVENQKLAKIRQMEKESLAIKNLSKGLNEEQIKAIPYLLQKALPDSYMDSAVADVAKQKTVEIQELKNKLSELGKNKSKAKSHVEEIDKVKIAMNDAQQELKKIRNQNKISYEQSLAKIANGDDEVAAKLKEIVARQENMYKMMADEELATGSLENTRKNYFPHIVNFTNDEVDQLKQIYGDDPEIGELVKKSTRNKFAKERKSYQTMAEVDNQLVGMQERKNALSPDSEEFNALSEKIDVLSKLYERDPFAALTKRYYKSIKSNSMLQLQKTFRENGFLRYPNERPSSDISSFVKLEGKEARALNVPENSYIHKEVLDGLKKVQNVFTDKGMENVLRHMEAFTNIFKTLTTTIVPSHYWYNLIGLVTNNTMAGVGVDSYTKAFKLLNSSKKGNLTKEQEKVLKDMLDSGVIGQTSYADLLSSSATQAENALKQNKFLQLEKKVVDNRFTRFARGKVSDRMDNFFRVAHYLDVLGKTRNPKLAKESVRKYLFNYSEITTADRFLKSSLLPFWNWTKNNVPLQVHKALTTPRFGLTYAKIKDQSTQSIQNDPDIPDWIKKSYMKFGDEFYNPRPPLNDLQMLFSPNQVMSSLSPLFRMPSEYLLNKQFFSGNPIDYDAHYGRTGGISSENLAKYLIKQFGAGSRAMSTYEGLSDTEDNKTVLDTLRDVFIGSSKNIEDVKKKKKSSNEKQYLPANLFIN